MPVSTERHSGFSISKWELKYLRCRYKAHRCKIAAAKPAIDANPPPERPHVRYKKKKALQEERRQLRVVQENFRILNRTMTLMTKPNDMPSLFTNGKSTSHIEVSSSPGPNSTKSGSSSEKSKYLDRPLTARLKRNTHIIFHWFIQRFGKYVPWWAEINY